jgi:hypothetical protein
MDTKLNTKVFYGDGYDIDESLLDNITYEQRELLKEMMTSGHYSDGINIHKFLVDDYTINLEKLELAVTLAVTALEANSPDEDVTLKLRNLDFYYKTRGIVGDEAKEREERTFILGFVSSIASEVSTRDTLVVKYVS